jgi:small subunit ribosomal protein S5
MEEEIHYIERVVSINRVSKTVAGGRRFGFDALCVVGDGEGRVGVALGKANEVTVAITKGIEKAKKNMVQIPLENGTISHPIQIKYGAVHLLLKPAKPGTGVIAGGPVRAVMEAAGIKNVFAKSLKKSNNPINLVYATMEALQRLSAYMESARLRQSKR